MTVPLVAFFPVILATPIIELFPSLGETGKHVEAGFAWVILKSSFAWTAYTLYFSIISFAILSLR